MAKGVGNSKAIKNRKVFETILIIFLVLLGLAGLAVSGVLIYQKRYLTSFWVNGQSMYPTLNQNITDENGNKYSYHGGGVHGNIAKNVDYGVMDCHEKAINKIKRFDIVVCSYTQEDEYDKIKRIVGLPGETIRFVHEGERNGDLEVKNSNGEYKVVEQPVDVDILRQGIYPSNEYQLGSDEYFVVGDNRLPGKSYDSRNVGAIKKKEIVGKVVAIVATCEAYKNGDDYDIRNIDYFSWPRFL